MDMYNSVNRAALGNSASLGDLYDARRDDFCGISIFKKSIPSSAQTIIDSQFSDIHLVSTEDFSEKVTKLDVSAELQVSVLAGLFTLGGSGRYLSDHKTSARSVKSSLVYNIKTKQESVNIYHEDLRDAFSIDAIENGMATHVVVAIEWGANSIVTCQYENKENGNAQEISASLSAQLKDFSMSISGKGSGNYGDGNKSSGVRFDVRMYGDILPKDGELPTTFEGALDLMKKLPSLVAASNDGKGKPLSYRLIPIGVFKKYLNFTGQVNSVIKAVEATHLVRVVQLFDQMTKAQQQLNDLYQDAFKFSYCVHPDGLKELSDLKDETQLQEISFKSELSTVITQIRSGEMDATRLDSFIQKIQSSSVSPQEVAKILASWSNVIERINFVRDVVNEGATFIGFGSSLDEEILKSFSAKSYILYYSQDAKMVNPERWGGNRQLLFQQMKNGKDSGQMYFVVDCDIHPCHRLKSAGSSCIQVMQSCQILAHDLLEEQQKIGQTSYVRCSQDAKLFRDGAPIIKAPLIMPCPGKTCNRSRTRDWHCRNCMAVVEYGFDQHLYCKCGKTCAAALLEFKCSDPKHGESYARHEDAYLQDTLSTLEPFGELNILVIGESADYKLDWVKKFASFLKFDALEKFEMARQQSSDDDDQSILEHGVEPGRKIYLFEIGSTKIRFVIPSGEIETLLPTLSHLGKVDAICMLFNPESANVNATFQNYFTQLVNIFGHGVRKNVIFSSSGTGRHAGGVYGQVMLKLKEVMWTNNENHMLVANETVYYFRKKFGPSISLSSSKDEQIPFSKQEIHSWQENVAEAERMLGYIRQLKPIAMAARVESVLAAT